MHKVSKAKLIVSSQNDTKGGRDNRRGDHSTSSLYTGSGNFILRDAGGGWMG